MMKVALLISLGVVFPAFAMEVDELGGCAPRIASEGHIIASGRDGDLLPQYEDAMKVLTGPKGVLTQLGLSFPRHIMHFLPGNEINCLVANNRHPLPHFHDGGNVIHGLSRGSGVLEFVCPSGCPVRSFYKDTLPFEQQLSIILHVAGHYHFGTHSRFAQKRSVDIMGESSSLAAYMEQLYQTQDAEEVSEWYQYLLSLQYAQDLARGTHQDPGEFLPERMAGFIASSDWRRSSPRKSAFPVAPTPSVLQAFVANLPMTLPQWKRELARRFERINRYISGAVVTKIINEGFATIMQELAVEHTPYNTLRHGIEYMHLHQGVTVPRIDNPYWFGRELYRSVRRRFNERPEIKGLLPLERDRRFIAYVTQEIIEKRDNFDSILFALDPEWVYQQKLALLRPANFEEWDHNLPPPRNPNKRWQWLVLSKDPDRIKRSLARSVGDPLRMFPRVLLKSLRDEATGHIVLGFDDEYANTIPLDRSSMVATLLVYARIMQQPVRLETLKSETWEPRERVIQGTFGGGPGRMPVPRPPWQPPEPPKTRVEPIRVVVTPGGAVEVFDVNEKGEARNNAFLSENFRQRLEAFEDELKGSLDPSQTQMTKTQMAVASRISASVANSVPSGLLFHAPTTASAIHHFHTFVNKRMAYVLQRILNGDQRVVRTTNGVAIKILPTIPTFQYDRKLMQVIAQETTPGNPDRWARAAFQPDDGGDVEGGVEESPGRPVWGPAPQGDGDGDGEEGEPDDDGQPGRPPGPGQGYDPSDPSWVVIPPELYAEFLAEKIKLPRLRPKGGVSQLYDRAKDGSTARKDGETVFPKIVKKAIQRGMADSNLNQEELSRSELLRRGMQKITISDWRVRAYDDDPQPEINAVVFFLMDGSGSMGGTRLAVAKKFFYDLRAILMKCYPKVEFRFVTFDTKAVIHKKAEDFFKLELLGGTDYTAGLKKTIEAQLEFPRAQWDRYVIGVGDMEDGGDDIIETYKRLAAQTEFTAMVRTAEYEDTWGLGPEFKRIAQEDEFVGYLDLAPDLKYAPSVFRELFKNP